MTPFELFVLFAAASAVLTILGTVRQGARRYFGASALVLFGLSLMAGYFAWRDHQSIERLKSLIDIPPYDRTIYVPTQHQIHTLAEFLGNAPVISYPFSPEQMQQIKGELSSKQTPASYWILESPAKPGSIHDFYKASTRRRGWEVSEESNVHLVLKQNSSRCQHRDKREPKSSL